MQPYRPKLLFIQIFHSLLSAASTAEDKGNKSGQKIFCVLHVFRRQSEFPPSIIPTTMSQDYEAIINLPHYEPKFHPRMSMSARAAQFAAFAALPGPQQHDGKDTPATATDNGNEDHEHAFSDDETGYPVE